MSTMRYGPLAFVVDSLGWAYIALLLVWIIKCRVDSEAYSPLQAARHTTRIGVTLLGVAGVVFSVLIGLTQVIPAGVATALGSILAVAVIGASRRLPICGRGPDAGRRRVLRWLLWVVWAVLGLALLTVFGALSTEFGGVLDRPGRPLL
ncbi:hypothetical protein [Mycobacteroides franklinii]|nr:hypothetical protein [Mycobacteroides franklinii]